MGGAKTFVLTCTRCYAEMRHAEVLSGYLGVGWGGVKTFMLTWNSNWFCARDASRCTICHVITGCCGARTLNTTTGSCGGIKC